MPLVRRGFAADAGAYIVAALLALASGFPDETLFADSPDIVEFTPEQLNETVLSDSRAWVVDYYAHWCPHCVHYAPKFKSMAAEMKGETRVQFGALDCALHMEFCGGIGVIGFPTIRVYNVAGMPFSDRREGASVVPHTLIFEERDFLRWVRAKLNMPTSLPGSSLNMGGSNVGPRTETASDIAARIRGSLTAAAAAAAGDAVHSAVAAQADKITGTSPFPASELAKSGAEGVSGETAAAPGLPDDATRAAAAFAKGADAAALRLVDAEVAVLVSLWQGAFLEAEAGQRLSGEPLRELLEWLDFLAVVLPGAAGEDLTVLAREARHAATMGAATLDSEDAQAGGAPSGAAGAGPTVASASAIGSHHSASSSGPVLERSAWTQILQTHGLDKVPPQAGQHPEGYWRLCRTYTCGLWTVFHLVMVSVAERQGAGGLLSPTGFLSRSAGYLSGQPTPEEALERIRSFVANFFGCLDCRAHFLRSFDGCDLGRCENPRGDGEAAALWLWKLHNDVTVRVAAENGAKLPAPWPLEADCPSCWPQGSSAAQASRGDPEAVYDHLRSEYWIPEWGGPSSSLRARLRSAPRGPALLGCFAVLVLLTYGVLRFRCCGVLLLDRVKGS